MDGIGGLGRELLLIGLASIPLGLSLWALLDIASRPGWAWSLAGRRQVLWLAGVLVGTLSVVGGVVVAGIYLARVRPRIADAEAGRVQLD